MAWRAQLSFDDLRIIEQLGMAMLWGMAEVDRLGTFTGGDIENSYRSCFPMPDGREWMFGVMLHDGSIPVKNG